MNTESITETEPKIAYWDCDDSSERLQHDDKDEAIYHHLDDIDPKEMPETIEVFGYKRGSVNAESFQTNILEFAYEYLSEMHDGEDGHDQDKAIVDAAKVFVDTYIQNYIPWGCEIVKTEQVNVKEWIIKHRPDWLASN